MRSKVARLREQIQAEYQAAQQGLSGLASGTARHNFITARTEHLAILHDQLAEIVGPDEAIAIVANTIWSPVDQGTLS